VRGVQWGVTVATAILLAGLASGCDKVTGGGWIVSFGNPLEKATFGFSAKCRNRTVNSTPVAVLYEGQLEYQHKGADIRIHGDVEPNQFVQFEGMTCQQIKDQPPSIAGVGMFNGIYRAQTGGGQGDFGVQVFDSGEPGVNGDTFCIMLTGAIEHANCGSVQGGNIQFE
jgi:hypothetical protein